MGQLVPFQLPPGLIQLLFLCVDPGCAGVAVDVRQRGRDEDWPLRVLKSSTSVAQEEARGLL